MNQFETFEKTWPVSNFQNRTGRMYTCQTHNISIFMEPKYEGGMLRSVTFELLLGKEDQPVQRFRYACAATPDQEPTVLKQAGYWAMRESGKYLHDIIAYLSSIAEHLDQDIYEHLINEFIAS